MRILLIALSALLVASLPALAQLHQQQPQLQQRIQINPLEDQMALPSNTPYYMQSPLVINENSQQQQQQQMAQPEVQLALANGSFQNATGAGNARRQLNGFAKLQHSQAPMAGYNGIPPSSMRGLASPPQMTQTARQSGQLPSSISSQSQSQSSSPPSSSSPSPMLNSIDSESPSSASMRPASSLKSSSSSSSSSGTIIPLMSSGQKQQNNNECFYEKRYFAKLDECLMRRPYPTVGLPAFKNEDLLIKRGVSERHGCVFVLNGGLFKNYQINKYQVESDSNCLDGSRVGISLGLSNTTLSYLWSLRCLNHANQLLDDATLGGKTVTLPENTHPYGHQNHQQSKQEAASNQLGICVGSSQNFGFTSIQLSNIEAQVELAMDIYKNWRVTNITLNMVQAQAPTTARSSGGGGIFVANPMEGPNVSLPMREQPAMPILGTSIRDFTFESLDGDELNWRYLHLYQNWSRNRMHTNFLDQYRRFLWISLQRCVSEASEKLPVKLFDVFTNQRYSR